MESITAIEIENLSVCFDTTVPVLCGFSLDMPCGEKVTLAGPSGSGKSTVLKCLLGLVSPSEGVLKILGRTLNGQTVWESRRSLAYVAQEPDLGPGTARDALERPFKYKANSGIHGNLERIPGLLDRFNLPQSLLEKEISTLSGGEKQRMALVSAILLDRGIILMDEASSALDKTNKQAVAGYFNGAKDLTVLSVSHDTEWMGFSSRVIEIKGKPGIKEARA